MRKRDEDHQSVLFVVVDDDDERYCDLLEMVGDSVDSIVFELDGC